MQGLLPRALALAALFATSGCSPLPFMAHTQAAEGSDWVTFQDSFHGLTFKRPATWTLQDAELRQFGGPDGHFRIADWVGEGELSATQVAEKLAGKIGLLGTVIENLDVPGADAKLVTLRFTTSDWARAIITLPAPIKRTFSQRTTTCAVLEADGAHIRAIANTLRLDQTPQTWLDGTLFFMEQYSFKRRLVDWPAVRQKAHEEAGAMETIQQARRGLHAAVSAIADRHSFLLSPRETDSFFSPRATGTGLAEADLDGDRYVMRVYADSPAAKAGVQLGDRVQALARDEDGTEHYTLLHPGEAAPYTVDLIPADYSTSLSPTLTILPGPIAAIELPDTVSADNYEPYRHALIVAIEGGVKAGAKGWVLDLRRNSGGSHWAMLGPLAGLLGEGLCGGTMAADGRVLRYIARQNQMYEETTPVDGPAPSVPGPLSPVALLTSRLTASAAECVTLAFVGRDKTRRFGEKTVGVPTSNTAFELWDGSYVNFATYRDIDRLGRPWDEPIPVDEAAPLRFVGYGTANDPGIQQALKWLNRVITP